MAKLDTGSATPLYIQLAEEIRRGVSTGAMEPGAQIMPEAAMCEAYGVSRITVRKAVNLLVEDKVLFRKQGKGTFVAYRHRFAHCESISHACLLRERNGLYHAAALFGQKASRL